MEERPSQFRPELEEITSQTNKVDFVGRYRGDTLSLSTIIANAITIGAYARSLY